MALQRFKCGGNDVCFIFPSANVAPEENVLTTGRCVHVSTHPQRDILPVLWCVANLQMGSSEAVFLPSVSLYTPKTV